MEAAVAAATSAPSVHNTQPWIFISPMTGSKSGRTSPAGWNSWIRPADSSTSAAGQPCTISRWRLRGVGFDAEVLLVPDGDAAHVATVLVRPGEAPDADEIAVSAAIASRHTQREPFANRLVEPSTLDRLRRAAESEGGWLAIVDDREDQIMLTVLL